MRSLVARSLVPGPVAFAGVARKAVAAVGAAVLLAVAPSSPGDAGPPVAVVHHVALSGVSCRASDDCIAVGQYYSTSYAPAGAAAPDTIGPQFRLAERWNGAKWSLIPQAPRKGWAASGLSGISCAGGLCAALGWYRTGTVVHGLVERWSRGSRSPVIDTMPTVRGVLSALACVSATLCIGVGARYGPFRQIAERWNGTKWQPLPAPLTRPGAQLTSIWCASARSCNAVGSGAGTLPAEHWDGRRWAIEPAELPHRTYLGLESVGLSSLACHASTSCMAVGSYSVYLGDGNGAIYPLVERWNGKRWSIFPDPPSAPAGSISLSGIDGAGSSAYVAVGREIIEGKAGGAAYAARSSRGKWTATRLATLSEDAELGSVACVTARACMAVGWREVTRPVGVVPLAERWSGARWIFVKALSPYG